MLQRSEKALRFLLLAAIAFICGCPNAVQAQVIHGSIYGQVTDATGAAVPNATITVTDKGKGTSVQVTSNETGEYSVSNLIPGVYDIKATAPGFGTIVSPGVQVAADTSPKIDLKLTVGNASETVTVTGEPPQLQTDKAEVGSVFNEKSISGLPIPNRNFASLQLLIPGAQSMAMDSEQRRGRAGQPDSQHSGTVLCRCWISARRCVESGSDFRPDRYQPTAGRRWRGEDPGAELRGGVRPVSCRRGERANQVGNKPIPRRRILVSPKRCPAGKKSIYPVRAVFGYFHSLNATGAL